MLARSFPGCIVRAVCRTDGLRGGGRGNWLTSERRELDPQEAEELNRRLAELAAQLKDRPEETVEYFVPDDRKAGVRM